jgi:peptidoglycan-associated lipoprotein
VGEVAAAGSRRIIPTDSTTYHLVARGDGGMAEANARVTVNSPAPAVSGLTEEQLFERNIKDVFFGYDKYDIRPDEQSIVSADAQFLAQHPEMKVVIEGHCDERGSDEYNIGLGENRAEQVKEELQQHGVAADRIRMKSYGKEKPFCQEETESCWQQNRRAHFVLQGQNQAALK